MLNIDYKSIKCPKCGKNHFKIISNNSGDKAFNGFGTFSFAEFWEAFGSAHREDKAPIIKNGEYINPPVPEKSSETCTCLECGTKFVITQEWTSATKYTINVEDFDKILKRQEELRKKLEEEYAKKEAEEKKKKEEEAKKASVAIVNDPKSAYVALKPVDLAIQPTSIRDTLQDFMESHTHFGNSQKAQYVLDIGGITFDTEIEYTPEQIAKIERDYGWKITKK